MKKMIALGTCLVVVASFALADDIDVSGSWKLISETSRGERTQTIAIEQNGANITVTMPNRRGGGDMTGTGTIEGNTITWKVTRETPRGTVELTYKGTVDGDTMTGTVAMGDRGSSEWSAKRAEGKESKEAKKVA